MPVRNTNPFMDINERLNQVRRDMNSELRAKCLEILNKKRGEQDGTANNGRVEEQINRV